MNELLLGILYLVSLAFLITVFFATLLRNRGPWGTFWSFFIVILLAMFATDLWVGPVGPYFFGGIYWVPPLAVGLLIALLLAATTPSPKARSEIEVEKKEIAKENQATAALGTFFWILFLFLIVLIAVGLFSNI